MSEGQPHFVLGGGGRHEGQPPAEDEGPPFVISATLGDEEVEPPKGLDSDSTTLAKTKAARSLENHRAYLTWALLIFTAVASTAMGIAVLIAGLVDDVQWGRLAFLLTPFHTLLGIAIGYYFAERRGN